MIALSPAQQLAANVTRSQGITSMDAAYVLKKSVGLREVPFPGTGTALSTTVAVGASGRAEYFRLCVTR